MTALSDHLWQSLLFSLLVGGLVTMTRRNSARVRLWLWRIALLKFLVPFAWLASLGGGLEFPVRLHGDPPPAEAVALAAVIAPWLSVDSWLESSAARLCLLLALACATAAGCRYALWGIHRESVRARVEELRLERDPDDREPSIGFWRAAFVTTCAIVVLAMPLLNGSLRASVRAYELLQINTRALAQAPVKLRPARPGMGTRFAVTADSGGVSIRNASLRELAGLAYGVSHFMVRGRHFQEQSGTDWMLDYRYDVRIDGPVREPDNFDTYALRQPVTRELAKNLGLEIYVNSACQPPCGKWGDRELVEVEPGTWRLIEK